MKQRVLNRIPLAAIEVSLYVYLTTGIHEQCHQLMANVLDVEGHVRFWWGGGRFIYDCPPSANQQVLIGLSGGIGAGLLFGFLWLLSHVTSSSWVTPFLLGGVAVSQFVYAIFDGLDFWERLSPLFQLPIAIGVMFLVYRKQIIKGYKEIINST